MKIIIKTTVDRDFMGGKTRVTKVVIDDADGVDLSRLLGDAPADAANARLDAPLDIGTIEVSAAMREAARKVFLSPSRIAALRETLAEVYSAMEQARRSGC